VHPKDLTPQEWAEAVKRALKRAKELTRSKERSMELVQAAIAVAIDPERPWDTAKHRTFADHLCDVVWSLHGNEVQSYRVTRASHELDEAAEEGGPPPSSSRPLALLATKREATKAGRLYAELRRRVVDDPLIVLLIDHDADADLRAQEGDEVDEDDDGYRPEGEMPEDAPALVRAARPNAESPSTRRALARGYSLRDIKNARLRLKRIATAVAKEDDEAHS
jgi:hypothetical protein